MKNVLLITLSLFILLQFCSCTVKSSAEPIAVSLMPDEFQSIIELTNEVKVCKSKYQNLDNLEYIFILDENIPIKMKENKINVSRGSVCIYYPINSPDNVLVEKLQENENAVRWLSTIKICTFRSVNESGTKPSIVQNNDHLFREYLINSRNYYVIEVKFDDTLVGWDIYWMQDNLVVSVGIPVNIGLDEGFKYCHAVKHKFK